MANEEPLPGTKLVEMVVESVRVHMLSSRHVVILKETERDRYLPIWIGPWEASAIAMKLQGLAPDRPLTHDLFAAALEGLGARVDRVIISSLAEETFHARLMLEHDGRTVEVDARPVRLARPRGPGRRPDLRRRIRARAGRPRGRRRRRRRGGRGDGRDRPRIDRRADRRPAPRRLPRLRQLARHRPGYRRAARVRQLARRGSAAWAVRTGRARAGGREPGSTTSGAATARSRERRETRRSASPRSRSPPSGDGAGRRPRRSSGPRPGA